VKGEPCSAPFFAIPAQAGTQGDLTIAMALDSRLRGNDEGYLPSLLFRRSVIPGTGVRCE
jgi:hypothetical protein